MIQYSVKTQSTAGEALLNANPHHLLLSTVIVIWINALPYLSRLPGGIDWVAQYLPDEGFLIPGLIFFHVLYSTPAIPLIWALRHRKKPGLTWALSLLVVTTLIWYFNKDYDLAADAQAAIGLVIFPLVVMVAAYGVLALDKELRQPLYQSLRGFITKQNMRKNFGPLNYIPGFRGLPGPLQYIIAIALVSLTLNLFLYLIGP